MSSARERALESLKDAFGGCVLSSLEDASVVEVLANPRGTLWEDRFGRGLNKIGEICPFQAARAIRLVADFHDVVLNDDRPAFAGRFPFGGHRFQGMLPPWVNRPSFSIRKHGVQVLSLDDYVAQGGVSETQRRFLENAVLSRKNIVISGGTGSGKTTFANALLAEVPENERLGVLEDTPELKTRASDIDIFLQKPMNKTMQEGLQHLLRLRPDRIVVGEVRDGSALDLLKAWNTGHRGGLGTVHADSAIEALSRLEQLVLEAVSAPMQALIGSAVDLVVQLKREARGCGVEEILVVESYENGSYRTRRSEKCVSVFQEDVLHVA